ncbi:hypothetical protein K503DRAFT_860077 [Rhizopogon vinicolor AM-OR11-026]|uniref:Integrase catalytic domain-containing protein n=1 Tax=Rhizopogon vinicolor AM-OR11-026 TaxID=1314800 RepID=A0A1B7MJY8_9AGAM|nr:hypothetical protein K503DRAFT_860077 [Rhizopogon vinicolor AM-OR11-026]
MSDVDIVHHLKDHYDQEEYGLSVITFRRMRNTWGWERTRKQRHTLEFIEQFVWEIRQRFPRQGAEAVMRDLRQRFDFHVPHYGANCYASQASWTSQAGRFWCAGVNDVWPQDQHDKWMRFGLWLHISLDPFTGWINWLKIWWTNKNPRLIARYYLDCCRKLGAVPLITQNNPGFENFAVANAQTMIRHRLDRALDGTLQHRWMRKHRNIKPEIMWSVFRRDFAPGFETILEEGITTGIYDVHNTLQNYVFRWLAIPWLQVELDAWLPVPGELFDEVEAIYAPSEHPVFDLVPPTFEQHARHLYASLGKPQVSSDFFWNVGVVEPGNEDVPVLPSLRDLPGNAGLMEPAGYQCMGGMANPPTQALHGVHDWEVQEENQDDEDQPEYAEFTDFGSDGDGDDGVEDVLNSITTIVVLCSQSLCA